jgi:hypothetical protein
MVNVNHSTLTDPYLHEPKGVSTASANEVYVANGSGSGAWKTVQKYVNGYVPFDAVTPAYQHSVTTSFTPLNPTFSISEVEGWVGEASPNARLKYTSAETIVTSTNFTISFKNNSGTLRNLEIVFYKNGSVMNGGHIIASAVSGEWKQATLTDIGTFSTNDYLEIYVKSDAAFTLDVASASLTAMGALA